MWSTNELCGMIKLRHFDDLSYAEEDSSPSNLDHKRSWNNITLNWNLIVQLWWLVGYNNEECSVDQKEANQKLQRR